jgi:hypothetical protein
MTNATRTLRAVLPLAMERETEGYLTAVDMPALDTHRPYAMAAALQSILGSAFTVSPAGVGECDVLWADRVLRLSADGYARPIV